MRELVQQVQMDQKALQNFIMKEANAASLKCTKKKI
jgi:hypothetical protein